MDSRLTAEAIFGSWNRGALSGRNELASLPATHSDTARSASTTLTQLPRVSGILRLINRAELAGGSDRTLSDSDFIAKEYQRVGSVIFRALRGTFSLSVERDSELILCRDKIGQVPLYFLYRNGTIHWCSLIAPLLQFLPTVTLNLDYLAEHLSGVSTAPYETPFSDIWQIPPGCFLTYDGATCCVERFWSLEEPALVASHEITEQFERTFHRTLERLTAPFSPTRIGVRLSGGYDSVSVAVGLQLIGIPVRAFHLRFSGDGSDESGYIRWLTEYAHWDVHVLDADDIVSDQLKRGVRPVFKTILFDPYEHETSALNALALARGCETLATGAFGDEFCRPFLPMSDAEVLLGTLYLKRKHHQDLPAPFLSPGVKKRWAEAVQRHWSPPVARGVDCLEVFLGWNACFQIDALYEGGVLTGLATFQPFLDESMWDIALCLPSEAKTQGARFKPVLAAYLHKHGLNLIANRGNKANLSSYFSRVYASVARQVLMAPHALDRLQEVGLIDYESVTDFLEGRGGIAGIDVLNNLLRLWQTVEIAARVT